MVETREDMKDKVLRVFEACSPPSEDDIVMEGDWDATSIREDFGPYLDTALPRVVIETHANSLPALKPNAFRYFLKDYLLYCLDHLDSAVAEYLIYRLHAISCSDEAYARDRMNLFSREQKDVVAQCCEWFREQTSPHEKHLRRLLDEAIVNWRDESTAR